MNCFALAHGRFAAVIVSLIVLAVFATQPVSAQSVTIVGNPIVCDSVPTQLNIDLGIGPDSCDYFLQMYDSFGDGWNGAIFSLSVDGVPSDFTFNTGDSASVLITVPHNALLEVTFTSGGFANEESYIFWDAMGNILLQDGPNPQNGIIWSGTADCGTPDPSTLTYTWNPGTGLSDSTIIDPVVTITADQTYIVTVTDSSGNSYMDTATFAVAPDFTLDALTSDGSICLTETVQLNAAADSGTYTYAWSPSTILDDPALQSPTALPLIAGLNTFNVVVTSDSGCVKSDSVSVFVSASIPASIDIIGDTTICDGGGTDLDVAFTPLGAPTCPWTLTMIEDFGGDWSGATVEVFADGNLIHTGILTTSPVQVDTIHVPSGATISVNFTNGPLTFGIFYQLADADGNQLFGDGPNPQQGNVFITTADCGFTFDGWIYNWSPGASLSDSTIANPVAAPNVNTTYTLFASDTACGYNDTTTVTVLIVPTFTWTQSQTDSAVCLNQIVDFTLSPDSGSNFVYNWTPGVLLDDSTSATPTATLSEAGTQNFTVNMESPWGCDQDATFSVAVSASEPPVIDVVAPEDICVNDPTQLEMDFAPQPWEFCNYTLTMLDNFGDGWNGATFTIIINGLSQDITLQNGGFGTQDITIQHGASIQVQFTSGNFPNEEEYIFTDPDGNVLIQDGPNPQNGTVWTGTGDCGAPAVLPIYGYTWTSSWSLSDSTEQNPMLNAPTDTVITYYATVLDSVGGCVGSDSATIAIHAFTPVNITQVTDTFCSSDVNPQTLTASSPDGIWYGTGITSSTGGSWVPLNAGTGNHDIAYVLNDFGSCVSSDTITIPVLESPNSPTVVGDTICEQEDLILTASSNAGIITWYTDATLSTVVGTGSPLNVGVPTSSTGLYWVNAVNEVCASAPAALSYTVQPPPTPSAILGEVTPTGFLVELYAVTQTLGSTYVWSVTGGSITFGQGTNIVTVQWGDEGVGTLEVYEVTSAGCSGESVSLNVDIQPNSIGEAPTYQSLEVAPNPINETALVTLPNNYTGNYALQLIDMTGRVVYQDAGSTGGIIQLNANSVASGMYLLRIEADDSYLQKIMVR